LKEDKLASVVVVPPGQAAKTVDISASCLDADYRCSKPPLTGRPAEVDGRANFCPGQVSIELFGDLHSRATSNHQLLSGDVAGVLRSKEFYCRGDIPHLTNPPHWSARDECSLLIRSWRSADEPVVTFQPEADECVPAGQALGAVLCTTPPIGATRRT
jgi:hypothetical protein